MLGLDSLPRSAHVPGHILQVITDTDRRGAQVFALDLHDALSRRGFRVRTVALAPGRVGGLDVPVLGPHRRSARAFRSLRRELRASDIAVAHGSSTLPACAIASVGTRTPFIYRQISDSRFWAPDRARRLRVRAGLARAAAVVALYPGAAETLTSYLRVPREKIRVVPNAVRSEHFPPADDEERAAGRATLGLGADRPTVVSLGALVPEKGVDLAVEAVGALEGVQLVVAGDGPERERLERRARQCAPARVVFVGSVEDPRLVYAAGDVLVLPSRGGDSMPAVLIEAGLMELPVVATPVEGIPEIVSDGNTGVLVTSDSITALQDAIADLVADEEHARRLGRAARARCLERFDIDVVAAQWADVLERCAAK